MIKQWMAAAAMLCAVASTWAAVDANTASEDALVGINGIGPAKARAILDERNAHGPFKSVDDLASRVKGIGGNSVERLRREGLTVGAAGVGEAAGVGASGVGASGVRATDVGAAAKPIAPAAATKAADARTAKK
ncbi:ComEA family DNA-binding protein [Burkholderia guangdongensis]|uniref:ComEA family DNA-binding protein n=1 Tax=Burkholderia guangdongensis TaxID=1792500 RepID=UPI0015CEAD2C|nr:helix-hairpin-helix domain-containing protein [Burkholderia guangdongensis]